MSYGDQKNDSEDMAYGQTAWGCASTRARLDSESIAAQSQFERAADPCRQLANPA